MTAQPIRRLLTLLCLGAGCGLAQISAPDTPAGHTLQAWLDAFNSDDRAKVEAYVKTVDKSENVDGMLSFRGQTGGFELIGIESREPLHLRFRVKEKGGPTTALGNLLVKEWTTADGGDVWFECAASRSGSGERDDRCGGAKEGHRWRGRCLEGVLHRAGGGRADGGRVEGP